MRLNKTQRTLLSRAARARANGQGLAVRPSTQRAIGKLYVAGLLERVQIIDPNTDRPYTALVPTEAGEQALAAAERRAAETAAA